ncbi:MAG: hypothetical protein ICV70_02710 [Jiangellaceae bacterium]|nr:hypothetical protein [Jiangellaceae bacterium]
MSNFWRTGPLSVVLVLALAGCGEERSAMTDAAPTDHGTRYTATAIVLESTDHGPQLCLGGVATSFPPQCGGPDIVGWDWASVDGEESHNGTTWGEYTVLGTYDGESFTLAEPPTPTGRGDQDLPGQPDVDRFVTPCEPPPGGWTAVADAATATDTALQATIAYAQSQPDYAGLWLDQSINPAVTAGPVDEAAGNDPARLILNVKFTGHLDRHRQELRAIWDGALCVSSAVRTEAELLAIQAEVTAPPSVLSSSVDIIRGIVELHVVADTEGLQQRLDERYGLGVVHVTSALTPTD